MLRSMIRLPVLLRQFPSLRFHLFQSVVATCSDRHCLFFGSMAVQSAINSNSSSSVNTCQNQNNQQDEAPKSRNVLLLRDVQSWMTDLVLRRNVQKELETRYKIYSAQLHLANSDLSASLAIVDGIEDAPVVANVYKKAHEHTALLFFATEKDAQCALFLLSSTPTLEEFRKPKWRCSFATELKAKIAEEAVAMHSKRTISFHDEESQEKYKKKRIVSGESPDVDLSVNSTPNSIRSAREVVTPFADLPYDKQLSKKRKIVGKETAKGLARMQRQFGKSLDMPMSDGQFLCYVEPCRPSPILNGYRNKCELACAYDANGMPTCGFVVGHTTESIVVAQPFNCPNVPEITVILARAFTAFMRESQHKPWSKFEHHGVFRLLTVRNSLATKELMVVVQMSDQKLSNEQKTTLERGILDFFNLICSSEEARETGYILKSLMLHIHNEISEVASANTPVKVLLGSETITEKLAGINFQLSRGSFFQVNVPGAEQLYLAATELAQLDSETVLLDVCCGTGSIGLSIASSVKRVIGVELVESAVQDAIVTAARNGIVNAEFVCGKAEDTLATILKDIAPTDKVVAIVDPPRAGLHSKVLQLLRRFEVIQRLVYVSCNPKSFVENVEKLVQPASNKWAGSPFVAIRAVPFDMFPSTDHVEVIGLLERPYDPLRHKVPVHARGGYSLTERCPVNKKLEII